MDRLIIRVLKSRSLKENVGMHAARKSEKRAVLSVLPIAHLSLALLFLSSCGNDDAAFLSDYSSLNGFGAGDKLLTGLLVLDQKHPNRLVVKAELGGLLLAAGNFEAAAIYLESGEALARTSGDRRTKNLLYSEIAELSYRTGKHAKAVAFSDRVLSSSREKPLPVLFTRAKALAAGGRKKEALADLDSGWNELREVMGQEDLRLYWTLLADAGRAAEALTALDEYERRYAYQPGIGLIESALFEKGNRIEESLVCAFKELEYQLGQGNIEEAVVVSKLDALRGKLMGKGRAGERAAGLDGALILFSMGRWAEADAAFSRYGTPPRLPFGRYLRLSTRLEALSAGDADLAAYEGLEPYLKSFSDYYYHLWRGMKNAKVSFNAAPAKRILERCILLSLQTPHSRESREELGRLLGLTGEDGGRLLLGAEIDAVGERVSAGSDTRLLDPVVNLLAAPDNEYQIHAMFMLRQLASGQRVREYLAGFSRGAPVRLRERIGFVLSE
jgi:tetratricopeptide (TPR) repeat protein